MVAKVRTRPFGAPWVGAAAGLVVGLIASAAIVAAGTLEEPVPEPFETDPAAVDDLLDAWERSRAGTFVVVSRFTRSMPGRSGISSTATLVQDPPTRIVTQLGSITGRIGDREISCTTGPDDELQCLPGRRLPSYEAETVDELALLRRYVAGPGRDLYFVDYYMDRRDGCFRLRLAFELPTPPLGQTAVYCFDAATGAPTRTEIVREEGRDLTEAVDIGTEVGPEDLQLPQ